MPSKITGNNKCPHLSKVGKPDCDKLGRDNPKPMISWNNKQKFPQKREYWQFIHNDGTRHNIGPYKQYYLKKIKGHPFETTLRGLYELEESVRSVAHGIHTIAENSTWSLEESEIKDLVDGMEYFELMTYQMLKFPKLVNDLVDGNRPDNELKKEAKGLTKYFETIRYLHEHQTDPFLASLEHIFNTYEAPARIKKRRNAYDESQNLESDRYHSYFEK